MLDKSECAEMIGPAVPHYEGGRIYQFDVGEIVSVSRRFWYTFDVIKSI